MTLHIGIVGCSAEGAALCYRTLCLEGATRLGPHGHPEISMHTPPLARYVECLERGDLDGVAQLMADSAARLARAGADFLICPESVVERLRERGCDAVVLGCTELPLALGDDNAALPTLDSTRLLARAALEHAVSGRLPGRG